MSNIITGAISRVHNQWLVGLFRESVECLACFYFRKLTSYLFLCRGKTRYHIAEISQEAGNHHLCGPYYWWPVNLLMSSSYNVSCQLIL